MKKLIATLIVGFLLGYLASETIPARPKWDSDSLYLGRLQDSCIVPTKSEEERYQLAVQILESEGKRFSSLDLGAIKFLAHGIYRKTADKTQAVCAPARIYQRASSAISARNLFYGRTQEYHLKLASKINNPAEYIVETVAKTAFSSSVHIDKNKDMRPLARSVLASFGPKAKEYSELAFKQMSAYDPLGTGAAQIAAATGHPKALPNIQRLMYKILETQKPISRLERQRFYELAYALLVAEHTAVDYTAPIHEFMTRDFADWILPPKEMCKVLVTINNMDRCVVSDYDYCKIGTSKKS